MVSTLLASSPLLKRLFLFGLVAFLTACQSVPQVVTPSDDAAWSRDVVGFMQAHKEAYKTRHSLANWRYSAKVGITTPAAREQANLVWQFADQANQVRLFGPLGVGAIKIDFDDYGVVLRDNRGVSHRGDSAEALVTKIVGWPIPIDALGYWLFGLPLPDRAFEYQQSDDGSLLKLRQLEWQIEYTDYKEYFKDDSTRRTDLPQPGLMPRKIVATKQDDNGEQIVVKLITKGWR